MAVKQVFSCHQFITKTVQGWFFVCLFVLFFKNDQSIQSKHLSCVTQETLTAYSLQTKVLEQVRS